MTDLSLVLGFIVLAAAIHDIRLVVRTQRAWEAAQWDCPDGLALKKFARGQERAAVLARRVQRPRLVVVSWLIALALFLVLVS